MVVRLAAAGRGAGPLAAGLAHHLVHAHQPVALVAGVDCAVLALVAQLPLATINTRHLEVSAGEVDLAVLGVGQLGALLLGAHAGQPAHAVTQAQLPLVLTTRVWNHYMTRDT